MTSIDIENLVCPISLCIFCDPVIAEDGFTYERESILRIFNSTNISPMTKQKFDSRILFPNIGMKSLVSEIISKSPEIAKEVYVCETIVNPIELYDDIHMMHLLKNDVMRNINPARLESIIRSKTLQELEMAGEDNNRLIHFVCRIVKSMEVLRLLIERGVSLDNFGEAGEPIHLVCIYWQDINAFRLLVESGVNLDLKYDAWNLSQMICLGWRNNSGKEGLQVLLENGVDLEEKYKGYRAIDFADDAEMKVFLLNNQRTDLISRIKRCF